MRATDFGQLLLLFSRANLERYEITYLGARLVARVRMQTFRYKQLNGHEALTVFQGGQTQSLSVEGEIRVRESDGVLARVTLQATDKSSEKTRHEEAAVDYAASDFGIVLPYQYPPGVARGRGGAENTFTYDGFHRFGVNPPGEKR